MYEYISRLESNKEPRSLFANEICDMLWQRESTSFSDIKTFQGMFDENIRNVYELYDNSIPLIGLLELHEKNWAMCNFGFNEDEYTEAISNTVKACNEYYGECISEDINIFLNAKKPR